MMLIHKYRKIILFIVFGVLTTGINYVSYYLLTRWAGLALVPANIAAWILAVLLAYATNLKWVFNSSAKVFLRILREFVEFITARVAMGLLDTVSMLALAYGLSMDDMLAKILVNVLVIIVNYLLSKWVVFR